MHNLHNRNQVSNTSIFTFLPTEGGPTEVAARAAAIGLVVTFTVFASWEIGHWLAVLLG